jgi:Xaa-Pro dipeptidase
MKFLDDFNMVNIEMFKENRQRVVNAMNALGIVEGFAILQGGIDLNIYDTDVESLFRQESSFTYLFGVNEPGFYGGLNLSSGESFLFMPRLDPSYAVWMGKIKTPDNYKEKYGTDYVCFTDEITRALEKCECKKVYVPNGVNKISRKQLPNVTFNNMEVFDVNTDVLYGVLCECRVIKSEKELTLLRFINIISVNAHNYVMTKVKYCQKEKDLEAEFLYHINRVYGCRYVSYTCVCCSGKNSSILHYGHAAAPLDKKLFKSDMLLLDMGAEYYGYDSDITCSYPANGVFTEEQKLVYNAVLDTQRCIELNIKAGISWKTLQTICESVIVEHLINMNLVISNSKSIQELVDLGIGKLFMPHSFGHLLGLDTHDVDSLNPKYDTLVKNPTPKDKLLQTGMVITNEPGIYFIEELLYPAFENDFAQYLNKENIMKYMNFGGVRLEDDIIVKENGCENMTILAGAIRSPEDIEEYMRREPENISLLCMECFKE